MANYFKLVNLTQTKEDRQAKYWLAKSLGAHTSLAERMRDWRLSKIERFFNLQTTNKQQPEAHRVLCHAFQFSFLRQLLINPNLPP